MEKKTYKERVLEALESCDSPLSAQELATLLVENGEEPWKTNRVHTIIYKLKKAGYQITTRKKGKVAYFKLQPGRLPVPEPVSDKPFNGVSAPPKEPNPVTLVERCAHLVQAGRSMSAYQVADFFEISFQEAQTLLFQVANSAPNKYKLTIRIEAV
jgi:hypothetical protein